MVTWGEKPLRKGNINYMNRKLSTSEVYCDKKILNKPERTANSVFQARDVFTVVYGFFCFVFV